MLLPIKRAVLRTVRSLQSEFSYRLGVLSGQPTEPTEFRRLKKALAWKPWNVPGRISYAGWALNYLDASELALCIDVLTIRRWNDFVPTNTSPVILDCGANIGISVLNYKRQYPDARITAFEPDPNIFNVLRENLAQNGVSDVTLVQAAVWIQDGEASFLCEGSEGSRLVAQQTNETSDLIIVRTVDLARYISGPVDLMKVDIEGAEFDVIPNIEDKLPWVRNMVIECHVGGGEIGPFARLLETLDRAGFNVAISSYGPWVDLLHKPQKPLYGYAQYILVSAWRNAEQ